MKKFLLSAFALAVAVSASAFQLGTTQHELKAKPFNGKIEKMEKPVMKLKKNGSKISSYDDISGNYVMFYYDYSNDYARTYSEVTITKTSGNNYTISGWWIKGVASDLTATVDTEEGTLTIPRQQIYAGSTTNPAADLVVLDEDTINYASPLVCDIYSEGIFFEDAWGVMVSSGQYAGQFYTIGLYAYLFEPNAKMTYTYNSNTNTNYLYVEQTNDTVIVGNFAGIGETNIILNEDRTFSIPSDQIIVSDSDGDFYLTDCDTWYNSMVNSGTAAYAPITGTGTETTLTSVTTGGWTAATNTGYWFDRRGDFNITRLDDKEFIYTQEEPIPDVYIQGEVGENTWAPNVGQQMTRDEETGLYTAEITCDGRNSGYNYFSFTTKLADNADDWASIADYRFGAVSEATDENPNGDFYVTEEMFGTDLSLTKENGKAFRIPGGTYNLTVNYADMKLKIEKVAAPIKLGDANCDGKIDVNDVTTTINYILKKNPNPFSYDNANVNGDDTVSVMDVTLIIDMILHPNNY